jgi:23S rRNA (cytidine2498-2'-O)-methyltransferase
MDQLTRSGRAGFIFRMKFLHLCQSGYEAFLARELAASGRANPGANGEGWVFAEGEGEETGWLEELCFPHLTLLDPDEVCETTVNALASRLSDHFLTEFKTVRVDGPWYFDAWTRRDLDGLGRRATGVKNAVREKIHARMARVAKLGSGSFPAQPGAHRGWAMFFEDFGRVHGSSRLFFGGQQRMADDPAAPSRSYLKVEEAYRAIGRGPREGERVVDLGAAPGGWSYSAAKRGATVDAIDNGPLKAGAADHAGIVHRREDGFRFSPAEGEAYDWLFCDMVEEPHRVWRLLEQWVERKWCRRFVINLKFGRTDPIALIDEVKRSRAGLLRDWPMFRVRHLFHDREEITVVGDSERPAR